MNIAIVGTGYVGLVSGISLAMLGHKVLCIDTDEKKVSMISKGKSPIFERDIDNYLKKVLKKGLLSATTDLEKSIANSDITIISVGTPTRGGKIDLSQISKASEQIGKVLAKLKKYHVVVVKSTVLPGVTRKVVAPLIGNKVGLCMSPEFLREGDAIEDALHPDRVIIGQIDEKSGKKFAKIYQKLKIPIIFTNLETAEMTKYAANSLFATLISFSNEIARIAESVDNVDVLDVWKGVHLDKRLSPLHGNTRIRPGVLSYILSGCGFGGSCFPKDTKALVGFAKALGLKPSLIKSVLEINITQPDRIILLLKKALGENIKGKKIAVLGLTFKPYTNDTRESPAFPIIRKLFSEGAKVISHDPMASHKDIPMAATLEEAIKNADAAIIVTSWKQYLKLTPKFFKENMRTPVVIDGRRIYDKKSFLRAGIVYKGIGL